MCNLILPDAAGLRMFRAKWVAYVSSLLNLDPKMYKTLYKNCISLRLFTQGSLIHVLGSVMRALQTMPQWYLKYLFEVGKYPLFNCDNPATNIS